ncbi:ATP-binding cassette domain-containing protein [Erwinia sp. LJJL01]|uniref:ATP-binding cassette domain-containing protein n=1 Tax=Erwinia sp. LJJL01 TaxID=3391839 RepID=UPI00105D858D
MTSDIFSANNLSFSYIDDNPVLNKLTFNIGSGQLLGLLGENGAGKSTLFNIIKGIHTDYEGTLCRNFSPSELIALPQTINLSGTLKNHEVFDLICCFNNLKTSQAKEILKSRWSEEFFYRFEKIKSKRTYAVSYGEKRWLLISLMLGLCDRAKFIILDEPTVGIDIQYRILIWELIDKVVKEGRTVFFSTHIFDELTRRDIPFLMLSQAGIKLHSNVHAFMVAGHAQTPEEAFINEIMPRRKND